MTDEEKREDAQTSQSPAALRARERATHDLQALVGSEGARTIVESIGGPLGSLQATAARIARVIDRALQAQQRRDRLLSLADAALMMSRSSMRSAKAWAGVDARSEGEYRGLAFASAERASLYMEWAGEVSP